VTRTPLSLAALASTAIPGLDPTSVEAAVQLPRHLFEVAFIQDTQNRRWVVRAPVTAAAGAQMEVTVSLLELLARRLPFSVPAPKGFATLREGSRAMVYPYLVGRPLDFAHLPPGPGIAAALGRALAALHNVDRALFDEAGLPSYDADTCRKRRLADLDRAAATGHVPAALLARWERSLEDVSQWRFAPTPTHGDLTGGDVLAVFDDDQDASTGRIRGLTGWDDAKVADPADDFAALATQASPGAFDSVLEAYAYARVDRPDKHFERRARLAGELQLVSRLLTAVGSKDDMGIEACGAMLRQLDNDTLDAEPSHLNVAPTVPAHFIAPKSDLPASSDRSVALDRSVAPELSETHDLSVAADPSDTHDLSETPDLSDIAESSAQVVSKAEVGVDDPKKAPSG
jgi:aminoglycoside phosphotransferase (APT) family kinase protein